MIETIKKLRKDIYEQLCENNILVKENTELKEKIKSFDEIRKKNEYLEEQLKLLAKENDSLRLKPLVHDATCDTSNFCPLVDMDDVLKVFVVEDCEVECKDVFACTGAGCEIKNKGHFENNVVWNMMQKMGYKGRGLGNHGQGIQGPIQLVMRPKYEDLKYSSEVASISSLEKSVERIQCSHCHREGHKEKNCWNLHPCTLCGLKNHSEKTCWNKESMRGCMKIDCEWSYGSRWQTIMDMIKKLFRYKSSNVNERNHQRVELLAFCI